MVDCHELLPLVTIRGDVHDAPATLVSVHARAFFNDKSEKEGKGEQMDGVKGF